MDQKLRADTFERQYRQVSQDHAAAMDEVKRLRASLQAVVSDILEYERVNNLAPNPGRKFCWDSVARAHAILEQ